MSSEDNFGTIQKLVQELDTEESVQTTTQTFQLKYADAGDVASQMNFAKDCVECNLCRSRCSMDVKLDQKVNVSGCVRCLECTTCGAVEVAFARPGAQQTGAWAVAPAEPQMLALAAFLRQGISLVQAELQLPKREHHLAERAPQYIAKFEFGIDIVIT